MTDSRTSKIVANLDLPRLRTRWAPAGLGSHLLNEAELEYRRLLILSVDQPDAVLEIAGAVARIARAHSESADFEPGLHEIAPGAMAKWKFVNTVDPQSSTTERYRSRFACDLPEAWRSSEYLKADPVGAP